MILRVGWIIELVCHVGTGSLCRVFLRPADCAKHSFVIRSANDFRPESAHDDNFFFRETFGNKKGDLIAAIDSDERETYPGVPGRGLNDSSSRPETAITFGLLNNTDCRAIFNAAPGVQVFEFGKNLAAACRLKPPQVEHRRLPNKFGNVFSNAQAGTR